LLYRPAYYLERSLAYRNGDPEAVEKAQSQRHDLDLVIGKNRLGPTQIIGLWCDPSLSSVDNKARF
jgi:replicative DNA helicase